MDFRSHKPTGPLAYFVREMWHMDAYAPPHAWERIMPSSATGLLINLADDELRWREPGGETRRLRGIGICGFQSRPFEIDTRQQRYIMGVRFEFGGASPFLHIPMAEVADAHVSLGDVLGRDADTIHQRLVEAEAIPQRFQILEEVLSRNIDDLTEVRSLAHAAREIVDSSVRDAATRMGISMRRLRTHFELGVGAQPKLCARVRRFERVLRVVHAGRDADWAQVAADHDYYDQAHFVHEFREFSGYTPGEFARVSGQFAEHVPLAD